MTWVAWRQYRLELMMGLVFLAAIAAFLVPTGLQKLALFRDSGLAACLDSGTGDCLDLARRFRDSYRGLNGIVMWLVFAPALIGVLLAAPIVQEFERRTYRLVWTQSVTRTRWLLVKLAAALLCAAFFAVALTGLLAWWYGPLNRVQDPLLSTGFYVTGAMPFVYTVFALAFALLSGAVSRRTIPAMLVTIVVFFVAQLAIGNGLRQHYLPPMERTITPSSMTMGESQGLETSLGTYHLDQAGNRLSDVQLDAMCSEGPQNQGDVGGSPDRVVQRKTGAGDFVSCLESHGVRIVERFHPADRFWTFQAIEAGIYLGIAGPLLGLTVWVVTRRMR